MVVRLMQVPVELEFAMQIIEVESFQANSQHTDHCWVLASLSLWEDRMMVQNQLEDQSLVYLELDVCIVALDFKEFRDALQAQEVLILL